jgi:PAS domain S-box-containing protein
MGRFLSMSLRKQMVILIVIMTVLPLGIIVYTALMQRKNDLNNAGLLAKSIVNEVNNDQEVLLSGTEQLFSVLAQIPSVQKHDKAAVNRLLAEIVRKNPQYANLLIADRAGLLWASAVPAKGPISYADRRYFKGALSSGRFSSGEYTVSKTLNRPVMNYGYPIKDAAGTISDVAIVAFTLDKYDQLLKTRNIPGNTSLLLTDHKGTILFVPTAPELVGKQDREDLFRRMAAGGKEGTFETESNIGIRRAFAYRKILLSNEQTPYMYVRAGVAVEPLLAKSRRALLLNVGMMASMLLLAISFALYISKRVILDKVLALRDASQKIAAGDLSVRVAEHVSGGELGELGEAFDVMADRLAEDILKLKIADEALREREGRLSVIFDTSQAGIILVNAKGIITFANKRLAEMFGFPLDEIVGMPYPQLVHPDEQSTGDTRMRQLINGDIDHVHVERLYRRQDGSAFWGYLSGRRHEDGNGNLISLVGVIVDISEIKQSQDLLRNSEERYRSIIELAADTILLGDPAGNIIGANESAIELTGYSLEELLGMNISDLFAAEELTRVPLRFDLLLEGKTVRNERVLTRKNGTLTQIEMNTKMMPDGSYQAFVRDMSEHRRRLEEMIKVQKLESLGVLAGGIAHDFNNILTGILGNISYARTALEQTHDAYMPLSRAEKASRRAASLARQLLIFAKGGEPVKSVFSVREVLTESLSLALSGTNVIETVDLPEDLHTVEADEGQISQALHNIIINAVQAMPGGGKLEITGRNVVLEDSNGLGLAGGEYVRLTFSDEGCGIAATDQQKIFDPYFTTKAFGTGLGLASTYAIINSHHGTISVSSALGSGTTFTIHLPSLGAAPTVEKPADGIGPVDREAGSILVMDDEEMVRELAVLTLERRGYTVVTCRNGTEAVSLYKEAAMDDRPFSVVIMDLTIPGGMGGVETAKQILAFAPDANLVVSSGYSEDPVMSNYKEYGFCAAIEKPYSVEDIARIISSCKKDCFLQ